MMIIMMEVLLTKGPCHHIFKSYHVWRLKNDDGETRNNRSDIQKKKTNHTNCWYKVIRLEP